MFGKWSPTHGLKMAESLINSNNQQMNENDYFLSFYSSKSFLLSEYTYIQVVWPVFPIDLLKWNSTLRQMYWIPDLQSLKLVCFMVVNTWRQKYAVSWLRKRLFWQEGDVYLIEEPSVSLAYEKTSNTGRVLLILH